MKDWMKNVSLNKFCQAFDAVPHSSQKRFRRMKKMAANWWVNPKHNGSEDFEISYDNEVVEIEAIAIHIPVDRLDDFLGVVDEQRYKEIEIRNNVPAVKLAYERYKMLLKMCGGDYDARY